METPGRRIEVDEVAMKELLVRMASDVLNLDQRLQAVEKILRDPILAAQCLSGLGLVSAPLTGESPAPSGAPSDPETRSGSPSRSY